MLASAKLNFQRMNPQEQRKKLSGIMQSFMDDKPLLSPAGQRVSRLSFGNQFISIVVHLAEEAPGPCQGCSGTTAAHLRIGARGGRQAPAARGCAGAGRQHCCTQGGGSLAHL
jgi:hypothetical protein